MTDLLIGLLSCCFFAAIIIFMITMYRLISSKISVDELETALAALNKMIDSYVLTIFNDEVSVLRKQHDLQKTQTNSAKLYMKEFDKLSNIATKKIMVNYLSKSLLKVLLKYYTLEGLMILIITNLRKR